jgi:hypothetical protein
MYFTGPPDPFRNSLIDGAIGEGSMFHETFGYYAHGVEHLRDLRG